MRTIHKFEFPIHSEDIAHKIQEDWVLRSVQLQNGMICAWLEVETTNDLGVFMFRVVGTDHPIPSDSMYCGTVQRGDMVWHLFKIGAL